MILNPNDRVWRLCLGHGGDSIGKKMRDSGIDVFRYLPPFEILLPEIVTATLSFGFGVRSVLRGFVLALPFSEDAGDVGTVRLVCR